MNLLRHIILFSIYFLLTVTKISSLCPQFCICLWRNGKQSVECANLNLLNIPQGIDTVTQVLDASGNNFQSIQQEVFLKTGLINLQKLFLNRCRIKTINYEALKGLTNLVELDLSENMLATVPTAALLNCLSLMKLSLSKNPITSLDRMAFNHLSFLTTLDLSGCRISQVDKATFVGLYRLEWIDLSENRIKTFPDTMLLLFSKSLKGVQLQDNPWMCDCSIRNLSSWLKKNIIPVLIAPTCEEPIKLRGFELKKLQENDIACLPEIITTASKHFFFGDEAQKGKNVTLLCQVTSTPPAKISWIFQGRILQNNSEPIPGLHFEYFMVTRREMEESSLIIYYNVNFKRNGTFQCRAENAVGISIMNYTIIAANNNRKEPEKTLKFEENYYGNNNEEKFPIGLRPSLILALGLIILILCLTALILAVVKYDPKSKLKPDEKIFRINYNETNEQKDDEAAPLRKSILNKKFANHEMGISKIENGNTDISTEIKSNNNRGNNYKITDDINTDEKPRNSSLKELSALTGFQFVQTANNNHRKLQHISRNYKAFKSDFAKLRKINKEPYLTPTLIGKYRPVSAPAFERFIENSFPNCSVNNKLHNVSEINLLGRQISYSEHSTPFMFRRIEVKPREIVDDIYL